MKANPALLFALSALPALLAAAAWWFYLLGNGWVAGTIALGTVPLVLLLPSAVAFPGTHRRQAALLLISLLLGDTGFAAARLYALDRGGIIAYCEDGDCNVRPPLLAALIREDESAFAGIALTVAAGMVLDDEVDGIERAAPEKYRRLDAMRAGRPGVNALLLSSTRARVRGTISMPSGAEGLTPAIVFLHGFGGSLTTYVSTLRESDALAEYAIVAPALSWVGDWWSEEGLAVIAHTLDTLPARIDRQRLALVGLSNGAVGVVAASAHPTLGPRFRAAVAIEGLADAEAFGVPRVPLLGIAARQDGRFPLEGMRQAARSLQEASRHENSPAIDLVEIEGDHMAFFTNSQAANEALAAHLAAHVHPAPPTGR